MPVLDGVKLTGSDRIVSISRVALPDQDGVWWQVDWRQGRRKTFNRGCRQFGEQWKRAQQRDLHDRHRDLGV